MPVEALLLVLTGVVVIAACLVYYLNQKNYAQKFRKINYVEEHCQCIADPNIPQPDLHGRLVHLTGPLSLPSCLDSQTMVPFQQMLFCERLTETYQYQQVQTGNTVEYQLVWSSALIPSQDFANEIYRGQNEKHCSHSLPNKVIFNEESKVGRVQVCLKMLRKLLSQTKPECLSTLPLPSPLPSQMRSQLVSRRQQAHLHQEHNMIYISRTPGTHSAGDQRLFYKGLTGPLSLSMVGRLLGNTLTEYLIPGEGLLDQEQVIGELPPRKYTWDQEEKVEELDVPSLPRVSICSRTEQPRVSLQQKIQVLMQPQDNISWVVVEPLSYVQLLAHKRQGYSDNRAYVNGAAFLLALGAHLYQLACWFHATHQDVGPLKLTFLGVGMAAGCKMAVGGLARGSQGRVEMANGFLLLLLILLHLSL